MRQKTSKNGEGKNFGIRDGIVVIPKGTVV
jgi:hypothetical protein